MNRSLCDLLEVLQQFAKKNDGCTCIVSYNELKSKSGYSRGHVIAQIELLCALGIIEKHPIAHPNGGAGKNSYTILSPRIV